MNPTWVGFMGDTHVENRARNDAVQQFLLRRLQGDSVTAEDFAKQHPELGSALVEQLGRAELVAAAKEQSHDGRSESHGSSRGQLSLRCPHCQALIEIEADTVWAEVQCSSCEESFSLVDRATEEEQALTQLGHFDLLERLGIGAFGTVWRARDTKLNRIVALKIPRKGQLSEKEAGIFLREAQSAAQIVHPNVVQVYEVGRHDDTLFIASEVVNGPALSQRMSAQRFTPRESAELVAKIARGLDAAHQAGVVHRDLKPGNILLDAAGEPHIADFGLAKLDSKDVTMTLDGVLVGTPAYMSPEQAAGKPQDADARSDVYALGVILFQLLTGELPFRGTATTILKQAVHDPPPSPRKLNHHVSRDLDTICLKALEKAPALRFESTGEMANELERALRHEPIKTRPIGIPGRTLRWAIRRPVAAAFAVATLASLAIGTMVSLNFAWSANDKAQELAKNVELLQRTAYAYDMTETQRLVGSETIEAALRLLEKYNNSELAHLRGPEWHHWWRRIHGRQLAVYQSEHAIRGLAVHPKQQFFVWGNRIGQLFAADCRLSDVRKLSASHATWIYEILFDQHGRLYSLDVDGTLLVTQFDQEGRDSNVATLTHPGARALAFGISHDGKSVAIVGSSSLEDDDPTASESLVRIWETDTWQQTDDIAVPGGHAYWSLFWSADDSMLVLGGESRRYLVRLGDPHHVEEVTPQDEQPSYGRTSRWLSNDTLLAIHGANGTTITRETADGSNRQTLFSEVPGGIAELELDSAEETLVLPNVAKQILVYDLHHGTKKFTLNGHRNRLTNAEFFENDTQLVSTSDDGSVRTWDLREGASAIRRVQGNVEGGNLDAAPFAMSPNGQMAAVIGQHEALAYALPSLERIGQLPLIPFEQQIYIHHITPSPDSQSFLIMYNTKTNEGWSIHSVEWSPKADTHRNLPNDFVDRPNCLRYSLDGRWILAGNRSSEHRYPGGPCGIHAFDRESLQPIVSWQPDDSEDMWLPHRMSVSDFCFSTDGKRMYSVSGRDKRLMAWSTSDQSTIFEFSRENNFFGAHRVAIDYTNQRIATAWLDDLIIIVDPDGKERLTLSGHQDRISSLGYSADGQTLLSSSRDGTVRLWDPVIGQLRTTFTAEAPVVGAAIRPQGDGVVAVDLEGKLYYWDCEKIVVR